MPADSIGATAMRFTSDAADLAGRTVFILAVPTPVTDARKPDLAPLREACALVAPHLTPGALGVVESTVYPAVTEDVWGPLPAELAPVVESFNEAVAENAGLLPYDIDATAFFTALQAFRDDWDPS